MRYMMLIYKNETAEPPSPDESRQRMEAVWTLIDEATRRGVLQGCEPLAPTSTATTIRMQNGKTLITDGPFAETKEQLAGYYIMDCKDLDEALEWAARIPNCGGANGCIEVRPLPGLPTREDLIAQAGASSHNG